jgi:peptide/nickel transport system ATP-binding protein
MSSATPVTTATSTVQGPDRVGPTGPVVDVQDLSVAFGDRTVVRDVSFTLEAGRCVAVVGESGSGKSVTARSLLGLNGPASVTTASSLSLGGRDLRDLTDGAWRRVRGKEVGYVLQDALVSLDPLRRVGASVADALRAHGVGPRTERERQVLALLSRVGIPTPELRARQLPSELSGGLRQRALIAAAIALDPAVLIADEPTTALDTTVQAQILALLDELRAGGTGLVLISHDLGVVEQLADEVIVMQHGVVVEQVARGDPVRTRSRCPAVRRAAGDARATTGLATRARRRVRRAVGVARQQALPGTRPGRPDRRGRRLLRTPRRRDPRHRGRVRVGEVHDRGDRPRADPAVVGGRDVRGAAVVRPAGTVPAPGPAAHRHGVAGPALVVRPAAHRRGARRVGARRCARGARCRRCPRCRRLGRPVAPRLGLRDRTRFRGPEGRRPARASSG